MIFAISTISAISAISAVYLRYLQLHTFLDISARHVPKFPLPLQSSRFQLVRRLDTLPLSLRNPPPPTPHEKSWLRPAISHNSRFGRLERQIVRAIPMEISATNESSVGILNISIQSNLRVHARAIHMTQSLHEFIDQSYCSSSTKWENICPI